MSELPQAIVAPPGLDLQASEACPFGASFFCTVLFDRVWALCHGSSPGVPIVQLHLVDGSVLDLCHVTQLAPQWISVAVFREVPSCDDMDLVFVPYAAIHRVTISARPPAERPIGFQMDRSEAALKQDHADPAAPRDATSQEERDTE